MYFYIAISDSKPGFVKLKVEVISYWFYCTLNTETLVCVNKDVGKQDFQFTTGSGWVCRDSLIFL